MGRNGNEMNERNSRGFQEREKSDDTSELEKMKPLTKINLEIQEDAINLLGNRIQELNLKESISFSEENDESVYTKITARNAENFSASKEKLAEDQHIERSKDVAEQKEEGECVLIERGPVSHGKLSRPQPYAVARDISTRRSSYLSGGTCIENTQLSPDPCFTIEVSTLPEIKSLKQAYTHKAGGEVTVNSNGVGVTINSSIPSPLSDFGHIVLSPNVSGCSSPAYSTYSSYSENAYSPSLQQTVPRSPPDFAASPESLYPVFSPSDSSEVTDDLSKLTNNFSLGTEGGELPPNLCDFIFEHEKLNDNTHEMCLSLSENQDFVNLALRDYIDPINSMSDSIYLENNSIGNNAEQVINNNISSVQNLQLKEDEKQHSTLIQILNNDAYSPRVVQERYQHQASPSPVQARNSPNLCEEIGSPASIPASSPGGNQVFTQTANDSSIQVVPEYQIPLTVLELENFGSKEHRRPSESSKLPLASPSRRTRTLSGVSTDTVLSFTSSTGGSSPTLTIPGNTSVVLVISPSVPQTTTASPPKFVPIAPKPPVKSTSRIVTSPKPVAVIPKSVGSEMYHQVKNSILNKFDVEQRKNIHFKITKLADSKLAEQDSEGDTYLHSALNDCGEKDYVEIFAVYLIDRYRNSKELDINVVNQRLQSPLACSISANDPNLMKLLLECGASQEAYINGYDKPLLHFLAERSNRYLKFVEVLSEYPNFNVDAFNTSGETALMVAVDSEGKDFKMANNNKGIIDSFPMIKLLLNAGARAELQNRTSGKTALHYAVEKMHIQAIELLCQHNPEVVNIKTFCGVSPLDVALSRNGCDSMKEQIVRLLIRFGAHTAEVSDKRALQAILKKK